MDINILWEIYQNLIEFTNYRKLKLLNEKLTLDKFKKIILSRDNIILLKCQHLKDNTLCNVLLLPSNNNHIEKKIPLKKFTNNNPDFENISKFIVITEKIILDSNILNPQNYKFIIENHIMKNFRIIVPNYHVLTSKHEIVCNIDEKERVKNLDLNEIITQLPKISICDPQIIWLGARIGDIIRIHRTSNSTGRQLYYRLVTDIEFNKDEIME
jgi:DNA-directed RNA polymerase subunit H (RpoH/RPB5)